MKHQLSCAVVDEGLTADPMNARKAYAMHYSLLRRGGDTSTGSEWKIINKAGESLIAARRDDFTGWRNKSRFADWFWMMIYRSPSCED